MKICRNSIQPGLTSALVESGDLCKDFFKQEHFIFEEKDKLTGQIEDVQKPFIFFCTKLQALPHIMFCFL